MTPPAGASSARSVSLRRLVGAGWIAFALTIGSRAVAIVRADPAWVLDRLPDDAFYYLEIARHLGRGDGSTFDGIHETNGYHPLWQLLLVPLTRLWTTDLALAKAAMLLGLVLAALAGVGLALLLARVVGPAAAVFAVVIALHGPATLSFLTNGMETAATVLAAVGVALALARWREAPTARRAAALGLAVGLAVLARIDLGLLLGLAVAVTVLVTNRSLRALAPVALGASVLVVPVAVWWAADVGSPVPVSARIKADQTADEAAQAHGGRLTSGYLGDVLEATDGYGRELASGAGATLVADGSGLRRVANRLLLLAVPIGLVGWWRTRSDGPGAPAGDHRRAAVLALAVVGATVVAKAVIDLVALPDWALDLYAAPQRVLTGLAVGLAAWGWVRWAGHRSETAALATGVGLLLLAAPAGFGAAWSSDDGELAPDSLAANLQLAADWIEQDGPTAVYGAADAGLLGYDLDGTVPVVNLDGLVNDPDHADLVIAGASRAELIQRSGIDAFVGRLDDAARAELPCARELWRSPAGIPTPDALGGGGPTADLPLLVLELC